MSGPAAGVALEWLLDGIATVPTNSARVLDLTLDSRAVGAGSLFFALRGGTAHGLHFAAEAVARGASAVLWEPEAGQSAAALAEALPAAVFAAPVPGLRQLLGRIADRFFGRPSAHLRIVGITGTNGKTTCAYLLAQCLDRLGRRAAYMGTLGWGRLDALQNPTHTTPDVVTVHRQLAALHAAGVTDVAMEVSSHALDQGRIDAVRCHSAAFTNLTRDHLDYHPTMGAYGAAKARLFAVAGLRHRVLNVGDPFGRELASRAHGAAPLTAVWVGTSDGAMRRAPTPADQWLCADDVVPQLAGTTMTVRGSVDTQPVGTRLVGRFNAENALIVLACLLTLEVTLAAAAAALAQCSAPPGRMELVAGGAGKPTAVIDYAHTPDALANALGALRAHCRGLLWCVFGCGGDRDPGKRPLMGAVADELADAIIVTDDNPRSEDPARIAAAITAGMHTHRPRVIHDRGHAIATALGEAAGIDMVLIAGKGHENYQITAAGRRSFSDRAAAQRALGAVA